MFSFKSGKRGVLMFLPGRSRRASTPGPRAPASGPSASIASSETASSPRAALVVALRVVTHAGRGSLGIAPAENGARVVTRHVFAQLALRPEWLAVAANAAHVEDGPRVRPSEFVVDDLVEENGLHALADEIAVALVDFAPVALEEP